MNGNHSKKRSSRRAVKVALVDAPAENRAIWAKFINSLPGFSCDCVCATSEEALLTIPRVLPDLVLMETELAGMSGIECITRLKILTPQTQVVIFTTQADKRSVFSALEAGTDGYLLKQSTPAELQFALLEASSGGAPMAGPISRHVVESFRKKRTFADKSIRLSLREEWILMLLCQGHSNNLIAGKLNLSVNTVCAHLKHVYKKLEVSSRTEAVIRYLASKTSWQKPVAAAPVLVANNLSS